MSLTFIRLVVSFARSENEESTKQKMKRIVFAVSGFKIYNGISQPQELQVGKLVSTLVFRHRSRINTTQSPFTLLILTLNRNGGTPVPFEHDERE